MEPQENKKVNWKRLSIMVAIVLVTALAIGGTTWYLMDQNAKKDKEASDKQAQELQKQIDASKQTTTTIKPTEATDETANWKTYSSVDLNISFKYPASWSLKESNIENNQSTICITSSADSICILANIAGPTTPVKSSISYNAKLENNKIITSNRKMITNDTSFGSATSGYRIYTIEQISKNSILWRFSAENKTNDNYAETEKIYTQLVDTFKFTN